MGKRTMRTIGKILFLIGFALGVVDYWLRSEPGGPSQGQMGDSTSLWISLFIMAGVILLAIGSVRSDGPA